MAKAAATLQRHIELDFIRGIALLLVMVYHYDDHDLWFRNSSLHRVALGGWAGVDLFFVLSGFLVGGLLMREWKSTGAVDVWRFLKRRAFKIWPSYYLLILTAAVLHVRPLRSFLWQNAFNVQNYFPSTLAHTWSLAVEEHFYLGAAALIGLWSARRWSHRTLLCVCVCLAWSVEAARAHAALQHRHYYYFTHMRIDALLLGVLLATLQQFEPALFHRLREARLPLSLMVAAACVRLGYSAEYRYSPFLVTIVDYGCAAALLLLSRPSGSARSLPYRAVARLGIFSYGIYLWHVSVLRPVDWSVAHVPRAFAAATSTLLPYVAATALGIVMTKAVEIPALRLRERFVPPRTPEPRLPNADLALGDEGTASAVLR